MTKDILEQIISTYDTESISMALNEYKQINPEDYDIYSYEFILFYSEQKYSEAYETAKKAVVMNPFCIDANYNMAIAADKCEKYDIAYRYLMRTELFQSRCKKDVVQKEIIDDAINAIIVRSKSDDELEKRIMAEKINHERAQTDPFKYKADCIGKILTCYDNKNYFIGKLGDLYDSYLHESLYYDLFHNKCELYEIDRISDYYKNDNNKKSLVPICFNYERGVEKSSNIYKDCDTGDTVINRLKIHYAYLPMEPGQAIQIKKPSVIGKSIRLSGHSASRKKLVISIFIDSFNYCAIDGKMLKERMPNTYNFFSKGLIFDNYYSNSEWTMPSVATYFTGKRGAHHMNLDGDYRMDFIRDHKILSEYFKDEGYITGKIGGNDAVTPVQGYNRGFDRIVYQHSTQGYGTKEMVMDAIQHIETFKDEDQYLWMETLDIHDVAGGFERSIDVQSKLPIKNRVVDNDLKSIVKQGYSRSREEILKLEIAEMDVYLGILYEYIEKNYLDGEIVISLFSDHGTAFMVKDGEPFVSHQRERIPLMIRGGLNKKGICSEIVENTDYAAIMCKLCGIDYDYKDTDANLPEIFGGKKARDYAISQSIFVGDPFYGAVHARDYHYHIESADKVDGEYRFAFSDFESFLTDNSGKKYDNPELEYKCEQVIRNEIKHLIKY